MKWSPGLVGKLPDVVFEGGGGGSPRLVFRCLKLLKEQCVRHDEKSPRP